MRYRQSPLSVACPPEPMIVMLRGKNSFSMLLCQLALLQLGAACFTSQSTTAREHSSRINCQFVS
ncbi:hypothetical protein [Arsenophonus endosymbiont of Aleurodicus floccissimus]|uniref:hypothetical protein n=1 Tax=Arsenophonus endosymbiont of Aleurodicus floccissimus TaxID=2152761 RepID=UPI0034E2A64C